MPESKPPCPVCREPMQLIIGKQGAMMTCYKCMVALPPDDALLELHWDCPLCHREMEKLLIPNGILWKCPHKKCGLEVKETGEDPDVPDPGIIVN